jgi:non-specific serine/threonine protein kinase
MIADRLDHYRLLRLLGKGGMGQVFLAEDTRLERRVAVKVLPEEFADDPARLERFDREVKILASLRHPGIVTVYSVESRSPTPYFTMELIDGEVLARELPPSGFTIERFFDLAIPIAEALGAAHEKGVTHRDIKPDNIMVDRDGQVKILDFGLARTGPAVDPGQESEESTRDLDDERAVVGTVPYMAPELLLGQPVDARSDIFSIGVLFYEMLTGHRPFVGPTRAAIVAAILRESPADLSELRADLPLHLGGLIRKCLHKEPRRRLQSVLDLRNELEEVRQEPRSGGATIRSIAVLPFVDMSEAHDQSYFCDGIAEELINALNHVEGLRVASRAASFQFRGTAPDIEQVGRRLHVDTVLEGSVRRAEGRLRVTAELVDVSDGYDLWSERFDREIADIFAIQDEIAHRVVDLLELSLSSDERRGLLADRSEDPAAYDFYLQGRRYFNQYGTRAVESALELYERALALDSGYARAWAGVADCHSYLFANAECLDEHFDKALEAAHRALELTPTLVEGHVALGVALSYGGRFDEADQAFERAVEITPRSFDAHYFFARHRFLQGRLGEAVALCERAAALHPDDYEAVLLSAQMLDSLDRGDEAAAARRRGVQLVETRLKLRPDDTRALYFGANAKVAIGDVERGLEWAARARQVGPEEPMLLYNLACIYSLAGDLDRALECLEACLDGGFSRREWIAGDSNLDALRQHPGYPPLMQRLD